MTAAGLKPLLDPVAVRAAINISLKQSDIADTVIESSIFAGAAIAELARRLPDGIDLEDEDIKLRITNAVNLLTAAHVAPAVPQVLKQQTAEGDSYQVKDVDVGALVASLRARAAEEIDAVLSPSDGVALPSFFGLAHGCRGR